MRRNILIFVVGALLAAGCIFGIMKLVIKEEPKPVPPKEAILVPRDLHDEFFEALKEFNEAEKKLVMVQPKLAQLGTIILRRRGIPDTEHNKWKLDRENGWIVPN
jgi:hypothetical protein